jgi:hypothetical protein
MSNGQLTAKPGKRREKFVNFRVDWVDYARLKDRAGKAGARTVSAYMRSAALTDRQIDMPPFATIRDLRNEVINLAAAVKTTPNGVERDRVFEAILIALERIAKF